MSESSESAYEDLYGMVCFFKIQFQQPQFIKVEMEKGGQKRRGGTTHISPQCCKGKQHIKLFIILTISVLLAFFQLISLLSILHSSICQWLEETCFLHGQEPGVFPAFQESKGGEACKEEEGLKGEQRGTKSEEKTQLSNSEI